MTIDEAIISTKEASNMTSDNADLLQLAEWLEELKELKKKWIEADAYNEGLKDGRADAKKEINEIMDMDVPISNILYEVEKWLKE